MIPVVILLLSLFVGLPSFAFPPPGPNSRHTRSANEENLEKFGVAAAAEYLRNFGYLSNNRARSSNIGGIIDINSFSQSINEFQRMAGLTPTGELNSETVKFMSMSRCGVEDTVGAFMMGSNGNMADSKFRNKNERRKAMRMKKERKKNKKKKTRRSKKKLKRGKKRSKRYSLEGAVWNKNLLKYHILNYTPDLSPTKVKIAIKNALDLWANYTTLRFAYANNPDEADLKIAFRNGDHGDNYPFDGPGGTLAHAFFPSDGRAHFDDSESFTFNSDRGINLFTVAAHEFGHSLGLAHSSVPDSLMAPFYQGYNPNFTLHPDDIAAIQQLYGKSIIKDKNKKPPVATTPLRPTVTKPTKKPKLDAMNICGEDVSFDSMHFDSRAGVLYAFKGVYYWKINDNGVVAGYPKKINNNWKGLPGNINAAVYSKITQRTYFFKGHRVWRFDSNRVLERGFPRKASSLGLPSNLNAATQWGGDGKIYVFKKSYFYQFSEFQQYDGRRRYPRRRLKQYFYGVPSNLDAAVQWKNGKTYFFKGEGYWRYSGMGKPMDKHYPKSVKRNWIGCNEKRSVLQRLLKSKKRGKKKNKKVASK